jgi:heme A synthase
MTETEARKSPDALSLQAHRRIVGTIGLILPALVYLLAGARPTAKLEPWRLLTSVSAYYYTGAIGVFVGVIFALSLFLFSYRGYVGVNADRIVGALGGLGALLVALFPTDAPSGLSAPTWWGKTTGVIHYVAAVVLFIAFILFSVWLFRKSDIPARRDRPPAKRHRDDVCLVCGLLMIACVLWAGIAGLTDGPIFLPEAVAITAFATSWLVKGEAHTPVIRAVARLVRGAAPGDAAVRPPGDHVTL